MHWPRLRSKAPTFPVDVEKMMGAGLSADERLRFVWDWVERQRRWYYEHAGQARILVQSANIAALVLSVITPILLLVPHVSSTVRALPATLAAVVLGATTTFGWRGNWIRWMQTSSLLEHEQLLFAASAPPYDVADATTRVSVFLEKTGRITSAEYSSWGEAASGS